VEVSKLASVLGVSGISESTLEDDVLGVSILCCERAYIECSIRYFWLAVAAGDT
jgi:hypothetical protein